MATEFRLYANNQPLDEELLFRWREVRIDLAMGMASEAELVLEIGADENGNWDTIEDDFARPFSRLRVEVQVPGSNSFTPLIDGLVVAQRVELSASPNQSQMTLIVRDDSALPRPHDRGALIADVSPSAPATHRYRD